MRSGNPPRVLIVEDDPFIGMDLMAQLEDAGFAVVGVAGTVAKALRFLDGNDFDVAVVDLNLGRESSAPIAAALTERRIPFVVVTGYSVGQCPPEFAAAPVLSKPVQTASLVAELKRQLPD